MAQKQILVVDDEVGIRELLAEILADEGYQVQLAENAAQAREYRHQHEPDLVLLDIWMPDTDGVSLLKEWAEQDLLTMPVVMMSGHGTIENAVEATRIGAVDFLEKPIGLQKLLSTVAQAISTGLPIIEPPPVPVEHHLIVDMGDNKKDYIVPLDVPLRQARDHFDAIYLQYHLEKEDENMTHVAEKIGIERTHLYRKLKQLGIKLSKKTHSESAQ
ncbi:MAG: response regulator [Sideroxydans sp.]|nr:response regulator [Sideroxydans sp.]